MTINPHQIGLREKQILTGLFLSKFDVEGLARLGFDSFTEAFNLLGYGLNGRPASIKNYRDEFDPLFDNPRKGWRNRQRRPHCIELEEHYRQLPLNEFAKLITSFVGHQLPIPQSSQDDNDELLPSSFSKRLATGRAAEEYFKSVLPDISEFEHCEMEDTTMHGCGYDFRLWPKSGANFMAIEVKGMSDLTGYVSLTAKEHASAFALRDRYMLFVVKNFREKPFHQMHSNPLASRLAFERQERLVVQVTWTSAA